MYVFEKVGKEYINRDYFLDDSKSFNFTNLVFPQYLDTMPISYRFIPIYGATNYGPMCSILEVGDVCDLKDCLTIRFDSYWIVDGMIG